MLIKKEMINKFCGFVFTVSFMAIMQGSCVSWSSPVELKLYKEKHFDRPINKNDVAWICSLLTLGSCVGCWAFALFLDLLGRRPSMIMLGIPMATSYLGMICIKNIYIFYLARFIMGFTLGGIMVVGSTYQSEIAPKTVRGTLMAWTGMMISVGTLCSYIIGPFVTLTVFNIILLIFPLIAVILSIIFCEESPYYLIMKKKYDLAKQSLIAFRKPDSDIDEEIKEIERKIKEQYQKKLFNVFKTKAFIKSFAMGNILMLFQQLTGINLILMYSEEIFFIAGSPFDPYISTIMIGAVFFISGNLATLIVERFNRRILHMASTSGVGFFEVILGVYCILDETGYNLKGLKLLPIITLNLIIFSYNLGNGPLTWIITAEIYPTRAKAFSLSVSIFIYSISWFLMAKYFDTFVDIVGLGWVCLMFAGCCVGCVLFVLLFVIETRGKTLGEIQDELKK